MKANLKGLGGIKQLLLAHGEKLGIAIVGVCAAMLVYHSLIREKLPAEKQADKLGEQITMARQTIEGFDWPRMKAEFPGDIRESKPLEQKGGKVREEDYLSPTWDIPWDRSPVPPTVYRTDPVLLDAQAVQANGGSGLLAFVDPEVRRRKLIEERTKEAKRDSEQKKLSQQQQEGQGRNARGRGGNEDPYGNAVDPAHPKRRPVVGLNRASGVALQDYEKIKVAHWAVVVAKVPIKEQIKNYRSAFENARGHDAMSDFPQYLGYLVERAEIRPGDEEKDLKWEKVSVHSGESSFPVGPVVSPETLYGKAEDMAAKTPAKPGVVTNWASILPEMVDPRYLEGGALAFPLPPLVGRDWGREVTHTDIPLVIDAVEESEAKPEAAKPDAAADAEPGDLFSGGGAVAGGMMERQQPGGYGGARGGIGGNRGGYEGESGGRGYSGGPGGRGMGGEGGAYGGGRAGMAGGMRDGGEPQAPHWLLRFFDFSVEPGKKYRYRVQMAMLDPNQSYGRRMVSVDSLDSAVRERVIKERKARKPRPNAPPPPPFRFTEWSKPSAAVSIPLAGSVRVASAKPASERANDEPSTALLVESFGSDEKSNAIQVAKEKTFKRGGVANMTEDAEQLVEQSRFIDPVEDFPFQTDITVVDIRGGERLSREELRPGRVLLMGPAGQMFVQDELSDQDAVESHRQTFAKEATDGPAGGFRGGFDGGRGGT